MQHYSDSVITQIKTQVFTHNTNPISHNTLRPRQNGRHFAEDVFKCIFCNQNLCILIKILLKFVPKGPINNKMALV